jgi:hypothetical protein
MMLGIMVLLLMPLDSRTIHQDWESAMLSLPKMVSGANTFEISDIERIKIWGRISRALRTYNNNVTCLWLPEITIRQGQGGQACPETRPCPRPSPGDRKPARTLAEKTDGTDVLLGNVEFQHRLAAQLNTHANSYAERWVRSVKEECLSKLILFGETSLRRALRQYLVHYHGGAQPSGQRQSDFVSFAGGKGNTGAVRCRERLGGLLKYYDREAA